MTFAISEADFHEPDSSFQYTVIINPKQSFGTGHHATTYMMISQMQDLALDGSHIADLGTGSGILAILASKMGAKSIIATEIDPTARENTHENIERNRAANIIVTDHRHQIDPASVDFVLANIQKNVLLQMVPAIRDMLIPNGIALLSGILRSQKDELIRFYKNSGFSLIGSQERDEWVMLQMRRKD